MRRNPVPRRRPRPRRVASGPAPSGPALRAAGGLAIPADCSISFGSIGPETPAPAAGAQVPGEKPAEGEGEPGQGGPGPIRLSDYVDIRCGDFRIQADTVVYDPRTKQGRAEGSVVLDWSTNRISGARLEFDLEKQTGTMEEATGWVEPEVILQARAITRLDEENVLLEDGTFTSCTQPVPYWSFRISRGLFHLDHYAHLRHVRMNVGKVPVFYLPWMLWPIKGDRATGFLFPEWGVSHKYGWFLGLPFFWPFADNADVTVFGYWFSRAGPAGGLEANWLPTERGAIKLTGFYLRDTDRQTDRWTSRLQFRQPFQKGWRLSGDLNAVSDFLYRQDFGRTLSTASDTVVLSRVNLVRDGDYNSLNVRLQRRQQFFPSFLNVPLVDQGVLQEPVLRAELIQQTLPGVELRGRPRPIGRSPLYFSLESSADWFLCDEKVYTPGLPASCSGASWGRFDIEPQLALPLQPAALALARRARLGARDLVRRVAR